ncbi:hypothetical protein KIW84_032272 [Lathyrus oleraceus]|uniref:Uncharacterized protein n=1 Tax=Pisum sativum TaxID=3888 RepID=A0A9D4XUG9_PEA|nr:hypothetical protein KIW84_032269 [Pisum sativum]KAI5426780.1 hypothetical protein KIW84_032272 [Pisum sativum]
MCTSTLPASRPSTKEVLKMLIGCRDPQANAGTIVGIYDDAPLLKNSKWEKQVQEEWLQLICQRILHKEMFGACSVRMPCSNARVPD